MQRCMETGMANHASRFETIYGQAAMCGLDRIELVRAAVGAPAPDTEADVGHRVRPTLPARAPTPMERDRLIGGGGS